MTVASLIFSICLGCISELPKNPVVSCLIDTSCRVLAETGYYESRGESDKGVLLVMQNVINRVEHSCWKDTIPGVVYQRMQYSYTHDGSLNKPINWRQMKRMLHLAHNLLEGNIKNPEEWKKITHYHEKSVKPKWVGTKKLILKEGRHIFYSTRRKCNEQS